MVYNSDHDKINKCKLHFGEPDYDIIIPRLFLGNLQSSQNVEFIRKNNIKYIFTVMKELDKSKLIDGVKYFHIPIKDADMCGKNLTQLFDWCNEIMANIIVNSNASILVHCKQGHHRSAAVVAAFILRYIPDFDFNYVVTYINKVRPCALRRDACVLKALLDYYKHIRGINGQYALIGNGTGMKAIKKY